MIQEHWWFWTRRSGPGGAGPREPGGSDPEGEAALEDRGAYGPGGPGGAGGPYGPGGEGPGGAGGPYGPGGAGGGPYGPGGAGGPYGPGGAGGPYGPGGAGGPYGPVVLRWTLRSGGPYGTWRGEGPGGAGGPYGPGGNNHIFFSLALRHVTFTLIYASKMKKERLQMVNVQKYLRDNLLLLRLNRRRNQFLSWIST
ncbi:hypothetical protein TNIN_336202 [Trichonephila inaurata madagascariensis]|uniref:Uncharacterized protein n=1 Tax=Trichonephila inaurata madagascariensis TaxID=2747483 RepID=A0A8X7CSF1_9ARAC|nr:hypothetical protein TNIN_336202 [Trichonephila inaurata madagascariensis]